MRFFKRTQLVEFVKELLEQFLTKFFFYVITGGTSIGISRRFSAKSGRISKVFIEEIFEKFS